MRISLNFTLTLLLYANTVLHVFPFPCVCDDHTITASGEIIIEFFFYPEYDSVIDVHYIIL